MTMLQCSIVIGSFFGDEGKGHMTDFLCNQKSSLNVRFNGGAQASHTVVTPDGMRHAFRHFGAGSFLGVHTYLSEKFIVNPFAFVLERKELNEKFQLFPKVFVHPDCIVTTIWDMYINQCVEILRGDKRHGSCGYGINETVIRNKDEAYRITVKDLCNQTILRQKLEKIQNEYVPIRLKQEYGLTLDKIPEEYRQLLTNSENIDISAFYAHEFFRTVNIADDEILNQYDNVVFEGAQGLLLDQNNKEYLPHVTTSNTGIINVMEILERMKYSGNVDIYYMSRCYMTRHGAGKFNSEVGKKPDPRIEDPTNIPNEFQGILRFGILDLDLLTKTIEKDLKALRVNATVSVVFTCLDQLDDKCMYIQNGNVKTASSKDFLKLVAEAVKSNLQIISTVYGTYGLTREFLKKQVTTRNSSW